MSAINEYRKDKISGKIHAINPEYGITLLVGAKHQRRRVEIDNICDYGVI